MAEQVFTWVWRIIICCMAIGLGYELGAIRRASWEIADTLKKRTKMKSLAKEIFAKLDDDNVKVSKVRVCESPGSGATYYRG